MPHDIWKNLVLAILQGVAEIFPISSSGHLVLGSELLEMKISFEEVLLFHLGSFLAILYYFRRDVSNILAGKRGWRTLGLMTISFAATAIVGWFVEGKFASSLTKEPQKVAILLIVNGLFIATVGQISGYGLKKMEDLGAREYLVIGLAQGIAALPGISRLGLTLGAGLMQKMSWFEALKLSFILSLPTILAANLFKLFQYLIGPTEFLSLFTLSDGSMAGLVYRSPNVSLITGILITSITLICGILVRWNLKVDIYTISVILPPRKVDDGE